MVANGMNPIFARLKLWIIAVLLAVLGFAMVAEFASDASYSDDSTRVRLMEMEEQDVGNELSLHTAPVIDALIDNVHLILAALFLGLAKHTLHRPTGTSMVHGLRLRGPPSIH